MDASRALKAGRFDVMPMGYLVSGPVGTGKTFNPGILQRRRYSDGGAEKLPRDVCRAV